MRTGGMDCINCHGGMAAVGGDFNLLAGGSIDGANDGGQRRPWKDLPRCQACHNGDAVSHLSGAGLLPDASGIRLTQAYRTGDNSASPLLATNKRFAEQDNTLFRLARVMGASGAKDATAVPMPSGLTLMMPPTTTSWPSPSKGIRAKLLNAPSAMQMGACN